MLKNTAWLLCGRLLSDVLSFLFYIALARRFGESGIGNYAFAFAVVSVFDLVIEFGLKPLVTREVAKDPTAAKRYCGNLAVSQVGIAVLGGLGLSVLVVALGYSRELVLLLSVLYVGCAARTVGVTFVACLEAIEAMDKSAKLDVISRLAIVLCGLGLLWSGAELPVVISAYVLGGMAYLGLAIFWVRKHFGALLPFNVDVGFIKGTLYAALPFLGASVLYEMYARVDVMMIHQLIGEAETGRYSVAYRLVAAPIGIVFMIGVAIYPALSRGFRENSTEDNGLFLATLKWLGILGMAGAIILICAGDWIVTSVFGHEFAASGELIRWMSVLFLIGCVKVPYERLLLATKRESMRLYIYGLSVGLNLVLNVLLIPAWAAYGAVWASIISEVFLAVKLHGLCTGIVRARYRTMGGGLLGAGAVAAGVGMLMRGVIAWPVLVGVTLAVFLGASVAFRILTVEDQRRLIGALHNASAKTLPG